jgi:tRNA (cmo5U34)-methyltransferase
MLQTEGTKPVHYPADPNVFEFDAEVSRIFPDMAQRSIPMYHEAHRAHVAMLKPFLSDGLRSVCDIGASRGAFFMHLKQAGLQHRIDHGLLKLHAVDVSTPMCDLLRQEHLDASVYHDDIADPGNPVAWRDYQYDVVVLNYVLQFIQPAQQMAALRRVCNAVKKGGYLLFGHKETVSGDVGARAQAEYIQFRLRNGYTQEEIDAKSQALKGAMFTLTNATVIRTVESLGFDVQPTTRWMAFNTFMARKGD